MKSHSHIRGSIYMIAQRALRVGAMSTFSEDNNYGVFVATRPHVRRASIYHFHKDMDFCKMNKRP
jgi:hypothetical protein